MATTIIPPLSVLLSLLIMQTIAISTKINHGFTVDLIHRDSPLSPFHKPSLTHYSRLNKALLRSISRATTFSKRFSTTSPLLASGGEYYINISIGTPPVQLVALVDTGGDLSWIQCQPCNCYKQTPPLFDPTKSSSFTKIACDTPACSALKEATCSSDKTSCSYNYTYADGSFTVGNLAFESLTVGSVKLPKIELGCGHNQRGIFNPVGSGIVGFGGGSLSLVSQLDNSHIHRLFSYFLAPNNGPSTISFGSDAVISGPGVVKTPLVMKNPVTYYYVTLNSLCVNGGKKLTWNNDTSGNSSGNIIIDSGTTYTMLPPVIFDQLVLAVKVLMKGKDIVPDPHGILPLCFEGVSDADLLTITAHFDGADVVLPPVNMFSRVGPSVVYLACISTTDVAVWGNIAQVNFTVGFDLERKTVSFKPGG